MSTPADAVRLVMPYRRWSRWVRALRVRSAVQRGDDGRDRVVLVYGLVLLALVYGPMLWSVLAQAGAALAGAADGPGTAAALHATVLLTLGASCVLAVIAARAGGPLWTSAVEVCYALGGQFRPRTVLWRRGAAVAVSAAAVAAFAVSALAAGMQGRDGPSTGAVVAWGLYGGLAVQAALAVGVAAQAPRWSTVANGVAGIVAALTLVLVGGAVAGVVGPADLDCGGPATGGSVGCAAGGPGVVPLLLAAAGAALGLVLVLRVLPDAIDVDAAAARRGRSVAAGVGLASGDTSGLARILGPARLVRRRATFPAWLLRRAPVLARDVLGLSRRPLVLAGSLLVGLVGAALVALGTGGQAVAAVGGGALVYAASATWAAGLRDLAGQPVPGGLLPGAVWRAVAGHTAVSALLGVVVTAAGLASVVAVADVGPGVAAPSAAVVILVLATRCWVCGATTAPAGLFTPVSTPAGDASQLVLGAWYLRGWLVVLAGAWAAHRFGPPALAILLLLAVILVRAAAARLERA